MKHKTVLAAVFAGVALSAGAQEPPRPDPETAKILQSVNMTYEAAREAAGGKYVAVYYDSDNAAGEAFASYGEHSCSISWSADGEGLSSGFSGADAKAIGLAYDKAIDRDIEKISLLHEFSHCTQHGPDPNNEYDADAKALNRYLATGGSRTTAQYWIYWRGLSGLLNDKRYTGHTDFTPTVGLRLQAAFSGGDAPAAEKLRAAYEDVMAGMKGLNAAGKKQRVRDLLDDDKAELSPEARQLLKFYDDGFRFLAQGAAIKPPAPLNP